MRSAEDESAREEAGEAQNYALQQQRKNAAPDFSKIVVAKPPGEDDDARYPSQAA